ncbi:hypothetical protein [Desulfosporosinus sp. BICA1-9]|uniref:hypothetical protein n=1 Tax=Desulfosporosinus sp. BICA1-9 TaxID=1531958 RepID=UPI00054B6FFF|nr:hypothetical protein [Desulfosporosinus sp. BICA1-9]KJS49288.1 MAG: hypothetical protein VR66_09275 [Peptococcaceae bacterium BRH_c23]KJS81197.1 MAG: hypothetical protein JL57_26930 [Desulfosporosinus sp. BICA1-9]
MLGLSRTLALALTLTAALSFPMRVKFLFKELLPCDYLLSIGEVVFVKIEYPVSSIWTSIPLDRIKSRAEGVMTLPWGNVITFAFVLCQLALNSYSVTIMSSPHTTEVGGQMPEVRG